jgi:type I restriction enzyme S subunit
MVRGTVGDGTTISVLNNDSIPRDWEIVTLGQLAERSFGGGTPSTKNPAFWNGSIPWVTTALIAKDDVYLRDSQKTITPLAIKESATQIAPKGSILVGTRVGVGKCAVTSYDAAINQDISVIIPKEKVHPVYVALLFKCHEYKAWFDNNKRGTTIKGIPRQDLLNLEIPLPPLPEQRAIARLLSTIHRAQQATREILNLARDLGRSVAEGLTLGTEEESDRKAAELGQLPQGWKVGELRSYLREKLRNGISARESTSGVGIRTFTLTAVTENRMTAENTKITVADPAKVESIWAEPGEIFIERANTRELVGLAALYEGPSKFAIFPDLLVRVRVRTEEVDAKFLVEFLGTPWARSYFRRNARLTAGDMPKIDHGTIERIPIPVPPIDEQRKTAKILRTVDKKISLEEGRLEVLHDLYQTLLHGLLSGNTRLPAKEVEAHA